MKKLIFILFILIFASSASATIYRWVDEKGVVNFTDDDSKIPPAYRNKVEEVSIPKTGRSTPSQPSSGKIVVSPQSGETSTQAPPIAQPLIREGDFAVKLAEALRIGHAKGEAEAESMLATVGIAPKNGWIADYPVTPDVIGELQSSIGGAVDSGKVSMSKDQAVKAFQSLADQQGLAVKADERQNPIEPPRDYEESEVVNNYYDEQGPPIVTYYPPPWDYYYLYAWVPYPFWCSGFWFPGFFCLGDFHRVGFVNGRAVTFTNHIIDPRTRGVVSIDPATRAGGHLAHTLANGSPSKRLTSPEARKGATSIFNRSASNRTFSQPSNTGRQYRSLQRPSTGSGRSSSAISRGGRSSSGGSRSGYSGNSRGGRGSHGGGGHGGGHR